MEDSTKSMVTTLKEQGYSVTLPRKRVFMALLDNEPQTIGELAKSLRGDMDRASIYRVIALFESLSIVERLTSGWKNKFELSDSYMNHHHHATCIRCGKIVSFEENKIIKHELSKQIKDISFSKTSHQLEVRGICSSCTRPSLD